MPILEPIYFGGLASREDDHLIPFPFALKADDCITDFDGVEGRTGQSSVTPDVISVGTPQHLGRFRPDVNSARTVVVIAGEVFIVTDPTTPTAGDGVSTSLGTYFSTTAIVSGSALNSSYYLSTDTSGTAWIRINWTTPDTYTVESLTAIPQGVKPTAVVTSSLTWSVFSGITPGVSGCVSQDNSKTGFTLMNSAWRGFAATDNGNDDPAQNSYAQYKLAAAFDATAYDWAAIAVSPHDSGGIGTQYAITIQVAVDVAGSPGTYQNVGTIYDVPPVADSPNVVLCDLRTLLSTTRSAIRWIKFLLTGSSGGKFLTYGYVFLPAQPIANPGHFFVDFENVATGEFSKLTEDLTVTIPQATVAAYPDSRMGNNIAHSDGGQDYIFSSNTDRVFNVQAGFAMPVIGEIGCVVTISGTTPTFSSPATVLVRLWEDTDNGRRLVDSVTKASATAYSFTVGGGVSILANQLYVAGGVPPSGVTSVTAHDQRLVAIGQNRVYISSFVPTSDNTNPFPQWPDIAIESADGWSFDVFPSKREQGMVVNGGGDALYIVTSESWYFMSDISPNSPVFLVMKRGALGHQAAAFFEERFFVASWDGVYEGVGRVNPLEMSESIRRIYQDWLGPDSNVCIGYDPDARAMYVYQDYRFLRYRFPLQGQPGKWTRGTMANKVRFASTWIDLVNNISSTVFTDAWSGMTMLQNLQTRANWNKHTASTDNMQYVNSYPPTGVATSPSNLALYYRSETPSTANYSVIAGVYNPITAFSGETYGPAARISTALDTFYAFVLTPGGICNLIKHVAGVETILDTYTIPSWNAGLLNYVNLKVTVSGTTILGYVQGPSFAPTAPSGDYVLRCSAVDGAITAVGKMGIYGYNGGSAFYIAGATGQQAGSTATITHVPLLANLMHDDYYAFHGGTTDLGADIPDWHYSTGFDLTSVPAVVKGLLVDATDTVEVLVAKTVDGTEPLEGRSQSIDPADDQDEAWEPGSGDFRGQKFRVEFSGANDVILHRAMWSREIIDEGHGG